MSRDVFLIELLIFFQCFGQDYRSGLQGASASILLHGRSGRGQSMDYSGTVKEMKLIGRIYN